MVEIDRRPGEVGAADATDGAVAGSGAFGSRSRLPDEGMGGRTFAPTLFGDAFASGFRERNENMTPQRSFMEASDTSASKTEMIQKRTMIFGSAQPIFS